MTFVEYTPAAIAEAQETARETGNPTRISHPQGNKVDLDEGLFSAACGDYSLTGEPNASATWATPNGEFVTVDVFFWVGAYRANDPESADVYPIGNEPEGTFLYSVNRYTIITVHTSLTDDINYCTVDEQSLSSRIKQPFTSPIEAEKYARERVQHPSVFSHVKVADFLPVPA